MVSTLRGGGGGSAVLSPTRHLLPSCTGPNNRAAARSHPPTHPPTHQTAHPPFLPWAGFLLTTGLPCWARAYHPLTHPPKHPPTQAPTHPPHKEAAKHAAVRVALLRLADEGVVLAGGRHQHAVSGGQSRQLLCLDSNKLRLESTCRP